MFCIEPICGWFYSCILDARQMTNVVFLQRLSLSAAAVLLTTEVQASQPILPTGTAS